MNLATDPRPGGSDGASNVDRVAFIMEVFKCTELDLDQHYDFSNIIECKDIDTVDACKHLCFLRIEYLLTCVKYGLIDPMEADIGATYLTLSIQRINWHLEHLGMGRSTPSFPFLN